MRYVADTSNKYYRVIVVDGLVIANWGRHGAAGQQQVHRAASPAAARAQALRVTDDKAAKGYWLSRDVTGFLAVESLVAAVRAGSGTAAETSAVKDIIAGFTAVSPAGRPSVTGSLSSHVSAGLVAVTRAGSAPAAPAAATAPSGPASRRRTLRPAGEQTRPNGQVYKPRDLGGHEDIAVLRQARADQEFVMLYGPPGTGKTALAEAAFAGRDGSGMVTMGCTGDTTVDDFVGTFLQDPATRIYNWIPGPLHLSVLADVPLYVDEIALADSGVLSILYELMDGRRVLRIPTNPALEPIPVGPGWYVIAACNPDAPGANMDDALLSRFAHHIQVESDWDLAAELGVPRGLITIARNLDGKRREGLVGWSPQLREALDFTAQEARYGASYAAANLAGKAPAGPDRDEVTAALRTRYPGIAPLRLGGRYGR
jgi:predicted DNA-binding WGR domain protein